MWRAGRELLKMIVRYYKQQYLSYACRKRYLNISGLSYTEETQKSCLLGNGAYTSLKTSSSNICNYVVIVDNDTQTRWFVIGYEYLNGGQVRLSLQRDVIGENGLNDFFGKIERGYTDTFLRNRKELNLNQRLVDRKQLRPITQIYGNYSVSTHQDEMWGILYFSKPSDSSQTSINIPILDTSVEAVNYDYISNNTKKYTSQITNKGTIRFHIITADSNHQIGFTYYCEIDVKNNTYDFNKVAYNASSGFVVEMLNGRNELATIPYVSNICSNVLSSIVQNLGNNIGFSLPTANITIENAINYDGLIIMHNELVNGTNSDRYLLYSTEIGTDDFYGNVNYGTLLYNISSYIETTGNYIYNVSLVGNSNSILEVKTVATYEYYKYVNGNEVTPSE